MPISCLNEMDKIVKKGGSFNVPEGYWQTSSEALIVPTN